MEFGLKDGSRGQWERAAPLKPPTSVERAGSAPSLITVCHVYVQRRRCGFSPLAPEVGIKCYKFVFVVIKKKVPA